MNTSGTDDDEWPGDELASRLFEAMVVEDLDAMNAPHVVLCRSAATGIEVLSGPYRCAFDALAAAEHDDAAERAAGNSDLHFSIARLHPAVV